MKHFKEKIKDLLLIIFKILILFSIFISGFFIGKGYQNYIITQKTNFNNNLDINKHKKKIDLIPTVKLPTITSQPSPMISVSVNNTFNYSVPKNWVRTTMLGLNLCLPPNWEADQGGNIYFNRDPGYRPNVTYINEIPYKGGSRRESFYQFWEREYPNVRQTVSAVEIVINKNTVLKFNGPEAEKIVWLANGRLWQADISNWSMINDSKLAFLKDFYTMISCSF